MRNRLLLLAGFTLIELMIVVAIIGVIAAIAFPSYQEHVMRSRRTDAKGVLLEAAQFMERIYTERGAYNKGSDGAVKTTLTLLGMPTNLQTAPKDGTTKYYNIQPLGNTFSGGNITKDVYTLQAAPKEGTAQANDKCGTLTISNTGAKALVGQAVGTTVDECWNR